MFRIHFVRAMVLALLAVVAAPAFSQQESHGAPAEAMVKPDAKAGEKGDAEKAELKPVGDPYALTIDAVTGEKLVEKPVLIDYKGREIRVNSEENAKAFNAEPEKYLKVVDAKMIEAQLPYYPLETCVVSGEKFEMGKPIDFIYNNRLVRFCCADCPKEFLGDPAKYMNKLNAAVIEKQSKDYPFDHCLIMKDEKFGAGGEKPKQIVIANQLVQVCCNKCLKKLRADPTKYMEEVNAARAKNAPAASAKPAAN